MVVNIGFKSDGVIPRSEFRDMPELKINDIVKVYVEEQENIKGQLILSRRKAKLMDAWDNIQKALDNDSVVPGFVKRRTKGGLIVDVYSIETFLPGSQIDVKPIRDYDIYVDKPLDVKIVKINYSSDEHTSEMVPVFSIGPYSEKFKGVYDNTEIFNKLFEIVKE